MTEGTLVLDFGTTALKAVLFDGRFRAVARAERAFSYTSPETGRMECDPYEYARAMFSAGAEVLAQPAASCGVRRIAVTGQAETLVFLDAECQAIGPAIVWLDDRARAEAEALSAEIPDFYARTGNLAVDPVMPLAKLQWVKRREPALDGAYAHALLLHDWAIYLLTGELCAEYSILGCSGYFDIRKKRYDDELLSLAEIDAKRLAAPCPPSVTVGTLTPEAAGALGLAAGTPVSNGMLDQCASAIGAGNVRQGVLTETTGTVLALAAALDGFEPERMTVPVLCHGLREQYLALPYCPTAGILLQWCRDTLLDGLSYAEIDRKILEKPVWNDKLLCLPHFCGKISPKPAPAAQGTLVGLTLDTDRLDIARAAMEGIAFWLRENTEALLPFCGGAERMISLGGGAKSALWGQIKADALGMPVEAPEIPESTALGCALGAAMAAGEDASSPETRSRTYYPGERAGRMAEKYAQYRALERALGC